MGNLMEQKRTLLIIAAVGIFLLVVLGAALLLYSPTAHSTQTVAAITPVKRPASSGWVSAPASPSEQQRSDGQPSSASQTQPTQVPQPAPAETAESGTTQPVTRVGDMTVISQNTTVYGLEKKYQSNNGQSSDGSTMIDLNTLKTAPAVSSAVTPENETSAKAMETVRQTSNTVSAKPAAEVQEHKAAPKDAAPKTAVPKATADSKKSPGQGTKQTAAKTTKKTVSVTQFWVQAAAFTSKKTADGARETLDNNKIPADVFTYKDSKGRVFYRVRIGPYTTKSEAEYWRTRIVQIPEFAANESYVTSTVSSN